MKNVINIVIDAFCFNNLGRHIGELEVTPFLNKILKNAISFTNIYSQAPYTEASNIALLGGDNTLEEGGYLFGNANTKYAVLKDYKAAGYHTILGYSPYVCSKAYLKGVTDYKYTRLFSIQPCFDYRFNYFKTKKENGQFIDEYYEICITILDEAFDAWIAQCNSIIDNKPEAEMISLFIKDLNTIKDLKNELLTEFDIYKNNKIDYINDIFQQWHNHKLIIINKLYNDRKPIQILNSLKSLYNLKLKGYQKTYEKKVLSNLKIDYKYILNMFLNNTDKKDFLRTIKSYYTFKKNKDLENYLNSITPETKCEVSLEVMLETFFNDIKKYDEKNENYFLYIQPQEFHLPSLFHSFDIDDINILNKEFEIAFTMLDQINESYKGNIIADLSARLCDYKLECFFNRINTELKNDFLFIVMADHGYPSYYNPPRPIIYNQTYTEAFHIPFIIYNSHFESKTNTGLYSVLDGIEYVKQCAEIKDKHNIDEREFILCEYAGPGCPMINEKKIWYTLITKELKLSAEVALGKKAEVKDITNVYNILKDPLQKQNLRLTINKKRIKNLLKIITDRSEYLFKKNTVPTYLRKMIDTINFVN